MAKSEYSEIFLSIEGEAVFTGFPVVYLRYARCNFECRGFNNPLDKDPASPEVLGFDPKDIKRLEDIPEISVGCDSIYSWHKDFSHIWHKEEISEIARKLLNKTPRKTWTMPTSKLPVILSLTGGEPTLRQDQILELLEAPEMENLHHVLIETNASVPLRQRFIDGLNSSGKHIIWSNSPKLSVSGEKWKDAIRPTVIKQQQEVKNHLQYFKFVCGDSNSDFDEVARVMECYDADDCIVYIMPMACTEEQQQKIMEGVALKCLDRGYVYCHRVHNTVFGNKIGT